MIDYEARAVAFRVIQRVLTEENTDEFKKVLKKRIKAKLPRWARWLPVGSVLDALLPEVLLDFFEDILV